MPLMDRSLLTLSRQRRASVNGARPLLLLFGYLWLACGGFACDRGRPGQDAIDPPETVAGTYELLHQLRDRRAYLAMEPYIDARHKRAVIDLLVAMDELLAANRAALAAAEEHCPEFDTRRLDMTFLANRLSLFSEQIELKSTQIEGDQAIARVQIGGRLPLKDLRFERRAGRWVYLPGEQGGDLASIVREMADAMNRLTRFIQKGGQDRRDVENAYRLYMGPPMERMREMARQQGN